MLERIPISCFRRLCYTSICNATRWYVLFPFPCWLELCRSKAAEITNSLEACEDELKDLGAALEEMVEIFEQNGSRNDDITLEDSG